MASAPEITYYRERFGYLTGAEIEHMLDSGLLPRPDLD